MPDQGRPVLGVLGAIFRPDRHPDDHRHPDHVPAHGLPFWKLVEHLIPAPSEEIAIHDLRQNPSSAHSVANRGTDNSAFRYRGIEKPVIRQGLGQSLVNRKSTSPVPVFLTIGDQCGILVETVDDGFKDTVPELELLQLGNRIALLVKVKPFLSADRFYPGILLQRHQDVTGSVLHPVDRLVGEHHAADGFRLPHQVKQGRYPVIDGQRQDLFHLFHGFRADLFQMGQIGYTGIGELSAISQDRILALPGFDFLF